MNNNHKNQHTRRNIDTICSILDEIETTELPEQIGIAINQLPDQIGIETSSLDIADIDLVPGMTVVTSPDLTERAYVAQDGKKSRSIIRVILHYFCENYVILTFFLHCLLTILGTIRRNKRDERGTTGRIGVVDRFRNFLGSVFRPKTKPFKPIIYKPTSYHIKHPISHT